MPALSTRTQASNPVYYVQTVDLSKWLWVQVELRHVQPILLRCTPPRHVNIPLPVLVATLCIYGEVLNSTCTLWGEHDLFEQAVCTHVLAYTSLSRLE